MAATIHDFDEAQLDRAVRLPEESEVASASVFSLAARHPALVALDSDGDLVGVIVARIDGERRGLSVCMCGPQGFHCTFPPELRRAGVPSRRIHREHFDWR